VRKTATDFYGIEQRHMDATKHQAPAHRIPRNVVKNEMEKLSPGPIYLPRGRHVGEVGTGPGTVQGKSKRERRA
jgi:hypothetical protein